MESQALKTNVTIRNAYKNSPDKWDTMWRHHSEKATDIYKYKNLNACLEDLILPLEDAKTYAIPGNSRVLRNVQNTAYAGIYALNWVTANQYNIEIKLKKAKTVAMTKLPELESWVNEFGKETKEGREKDREIWRLKGQIELIDKILETEE